MKRQGSEPAAAAAAAVAAVAVAAVAVALCAKLQVCRRLSRLTEQKCRFVAVCLG